MINGKGNGIAFVLFASNHTLILGADRGTEEAPRREIWESFDLGDERERGIVQRMADVINGALSSALDGEMMVAQQSLLATAASASLRDELAERSGNVRRSPRAFCDVRQGLLKSDVSAQAWEAATDAAKFAQDVDLELYGYRSGQETQKEIDEQASQTWYALRAESDNDAG